MKTKGLLFSLIIAAMILAGPATAANQKSGSSDGSLIGSWQCQGPGGTVPLVFESRSRLVFDGEPYEYKMHSSVLRVKEGKKAVDYRYLLKGNNLQITYPDGSRMVCQKATQTQAAKVDKGAAGVATAGGGKDLDWQLKGMLCSWGGSSSSSSSYSRSTRVSFDGKGGFRYASESSFGSGAGMAYGRNAGSGNTGRYRVAGDKVHLTFGDGSSGVAQVHMRQSNGRITEIKYNGQLYATGLCD